MKLPYNSPLEKLSIVVLPPSDVVEEVSQLKRKLEAQIGTYQSCDALAHITFNTFEAKNSTVQIWEDYISGFVKMQKTIPLCFNRVEAFSNGSLVLLGDSETDLVLSSIMKNFNSNRPKGYVKKSKRAHITIGRRLSHDQMNIALFLFKDVALQFDLDSIVLRRLDMKLQQHENINTFPFVGNAQISL